MLTAKLARGFTILMICTALALNALPASATTMHMRTSSHHHQFWLNQKLLHTYQVLSISSHQLIVSDGIQNFPLHISPDTLIWVNGHMALYAKVNNISPGEYITVVIRHHSPLLVAKKIYGPIQQIWGKVISVKNNIIIAQEINASHKTTPANRVLRLMVNGDTIIKSPQNNMTIKPGEYIQAAIVGKYPQIMLIQGVQLFSSLPPLA